MRSARPVPARAGKPLRTGAGPLFPLRAAPFPPSVPGDGGRAGIDPVQGLHQPVETPLRGSPRYFPRRAGRPRPERPAFERAGRRLSRIGLPDAGRPGAPQRALGARQPVDVPHRAPGRLSPANSPRAAGVRGSCAGIPDSARGHARAHGPDTQRVERHFLSRDGFPGRRPRAECLGGSRRAPRRPPGRAQAARRSVPARHRSTGAPPGQRRSESQRRNRFDRRSLRFRTRLPGPA